jgi:thiamine-phosphate pyrophosphorylase
MNLPPLYAIVDGDAGDWQAHSQALLAAGVSLLQLRAKSLSPRDYYERSGVVREMTRRAGAQFAVNDRPDIAAAVEADVLHLGQDDVPVAAARAVFHGLIGLSTHNIEQVAAVDWRLVDYIGFGPIFATTSKTNPDPVTGTDKLAEAVAAARGPVVAIGGITLANAAAVKRAGATSAAVISALRGADAAEVKRQVDAFFHVLVQAGAA